MKKKGKIRSFAKRLTWGIALTQLVVMALASYLIYIVIEDFVRGEEQDLYKSYLTISHGSIRNILSEVSLGATNHQAEIEASLDYPDKMAAIMEHIVANNPHIRSCGISFVAGYYPQKGRWFCPLAVKGDSGQVERRFIGDAQNDYLTKEWFTQALQADSAFWSKPFFDSTDSIPLVAWLMPVHDRKGRTVAIVGADMPLGMFGGKRIKGLGYNGNEFNVYIGSDPHGDFGSHHDAFNGGYENNLDVDRKWRFLSYNFIIDSDGTYIAHPDSSLVIKGNYFECAKATADTIDDHIGRRMAAGDWGTYHDERGNPSHFEYFDFESFNAYMFYEPIEGTDWSIALAVPRFVIDGLGMAIGTVLLILIALALLVTRIVGRIIIKRATKPLKKLADSAGEVAKGNFNTPLPRIKHNDEIRLLRDSFEGMQHSLSDYVDELKKTTASKAAIENELRVAHDIQMSMLPKTFPPFPERDDIDIYGTLTPAKDVGGDLFDFFIRDERLFFCIGDVSGKGVPASLVMAVTRSLFRNISAHVAEPHHIVKTLNKAMADGNETSMFVTLFVGVIDLQTGVLHYCNAGHNSPLIIGRSVSLLPCDANLPIGIVNDWSFTCQQIELEPQTTIFLYTDGLNEAEDVTHAQFGEQRIIGVANSFTGEEAGQPTTLVGKMAEAVSNFVGEAEQSDDLTMLAIKYANTNGKEG